MAQGSLSVDYLKAGLAWLSEYQAQIITGVIIAVVSAAIIWLSTTIRKGLWQLLRWLWAGILYLPSWLKDVLCRLWGGSALTEVQRYGVRFHLTPQAWKHLGKDDPAKIADRTINDLVHGPFCMKCHRTLVVPGHAPFSSDDTVLKACIECEQRWTTTRDTIFLFDCKRLLWNDLDGEMRQDGKIAPIRQGGRHP